MTFATLKREKNWAEFTFAKSSGIVTWDKENRLTNSSPACPLLGSQNSLRKLTHPTAFLQGRILSHFPAQLTTKIEKFAIRLL